MQGTASLGAAPQTCCCSRKAGQPAVPLVKVLRWRGSATAAARRGETAVHAARREKSAVHAARREEAAVHAARREESAVHAAHGDTNRGSSSSGSRKIRRRGCWRCSRGAALESPGHQPQWRSASHAAPIVFQVESRSSCRRSNRSVLSQMASRTKICHRLRHPSPPFPLVPPPQAHRRSLRSVAAHRGSHLRRGQSTSTRSCCIPSSRALQWRQTAGAWGLAVSETGGGGLEVTSSEPEPNVGED